MVATDPEELLSGISGRRRCAGAPEPAAVLSSAGAPLLRPVLARVQHARMRRTLVVAVLTALAAPFAACSGEDSASTGATAATTGPATTGSGGSGATTSAATGTTASAGGAGTGAAGGAGGGTASSASAGGGGAGQGGGSGGGAPDAGPDVSFEYDAGPGDGAVNADSACAAEVVSPQKLPVDIIWVVDTSGSMTAEIAQIKANINAQFADILAASGLDYQVLMIAAKGTAALQVCVAPPLGGPNCNANAPLYRPIPQTVGSTNSLSLILATYDSVNPSLNWQSSLRYDAAKVFIEVTDDNSSLSANSFDTQLLAKMPAGMFGTAADRNYVFYSIIGVTAGNPAVKCPSAVNTGAQYQTLSNLTGGAMFPVCDADYSPIFNQIAAGIVGGLACEFTMPTSNGSAIDPENVAMTFTPTGGMPVDVPRVTDAASCNGPGWHYDDNVTPTKLLLCPDSCATVKADDGGKIDILVGCLSG